MLLERENDRASYKEWEEKDNNFFLEQAKTRSEIRISQGRPKPIDIIYKNLNRDSQFRIDPFPPYKIFKGLPISELEELRNEIYMYLELDSHKTFWESLRVVCDHQMEKLASISSATKKDHSDGVHKSIHSDITFLLKGKSFQELETLRLQIMAKIEDGGGTIDTEYWECLLKRLVIYRAKATLREIHAQLLTEYEERQKQHRQELEQQTESQFLEKPNVSREVLPLASSVTSVKVKSEPETKEDVEEQGVSDAKEVPTEEESNQYTFEEYLDAVRKAEEEQQQRETLQREVERLRDVVAEVIKPTTSKSVEEEMYFKEASNGMGENEEGFNDETPLLQRNYWWHDKYRPRKPKYFNRIRTGYEWNKYNQIHYDRRSGIQI
jgi:hypothetical protein